MQIGKRFAIKSDKNKCLSFDKHRFKQELVRVEIFRNGDMEVTIVGYVSNTGNSLPSDRNYKKNITNLSSRT